MTVSPFDSALLGPLFGDAELGELFSDAAAVAAMTRVERALARAEGACGVIPPEAAAAIDAGLAGVAVAPAALAAGTASAGVAVPALVAELRKALAPGAGQWLHWGATSQDIVDTALALRLAAALDLLAARIDALAAALATAARAWADLPMAGRTRSQVATPISFGLRVARWRQPLPALRAGLDGLRPRVARVQLGGAVGSNAAIAPQGRAVAAAMAAELGLAAGPAWHVDRSGMGALAGWCAGLTGALGKMAGDLILMGRTESAEARAGAGGGSSTMPQKANPVGAETIVALARLAAALATPMHLAALHAEERDGAAWGLEWLVLPQSLVAAAAALRHAQALADTLAPDAQRMRAVLGLDGGAVMAEAASFALAETMPRAEAQALVKRAVTGRAADETLAQAIARLGGPVLDLDPGRGLAGLRDAIEEALAAD
ncbi:lyase family protein [Amaricoccus sp.]|uniref:lyase family protein n=1 Tax=Amaricoccus sp. TaxID=1872485 RepID=UPI001B78AA1C|nr:lyase family protein [Amaricoccus sp.]MBP7000262.1 3-carboxy-cis,cis-muconate cycloisomerase [Amaricoccus sp.]